MYYRSIAEFIEHQPLIVVSFDASTREAAEIMSQNKVGALPVLVGNKLAGIVTERDLVNKIIVRGHNSETTTLDQIMTRHPFTIAAERSLVSALDIMLENGFSHLPVTQNKQLRGMLSMRDIPMEYWAIRNNWVEVGVASQIVHH